MIEVYLFMGLCSILPIFAGYQTYRSYREGVGKVAVVLRDILFLVGQASVLGLLLGCMFKFAIIDTPLAMWSAIGIPIYLALATLLNYLLYFLLLCFIPQAKTAKYPSYQTMKKVFIGILLVIGTAFFIISE